MEKMVPLGLVMAWFLAAFPTKRLPKLSIETTEGIVLSPSLEGIIWGVTSIIVETH